MPSLDGRNIFGGDAFDGWGNIIGGDALIGWLGEYIGGTEVSSEVGSVPSLDFQTRGLLVST